jgi:hypothetical protein
VAGAVDREEGAGVNASAPAPDFLANDLIGASRLERIDLGGIVLLIRANPSASYFASFRSRIALEKRSVFSAPAIG